MYAFKINKKFALNGVELKTTPLKTVLVIDNSNTHRKSPANTFFLMEMKTVNEVFVFKQ